MKDGINIYRVMVGDEVICEGGAQEIHEKIGVPRDQVSAYSRIEYKFKGKYAIKFVGIYRKIYEISKTEDGKLITHRGSIHDIKKIVYSNHSNILEAIAQDRKLLKEWDVKIVGSEIQYAR